MAHSRYFTVKAGGTYLSNEVIHNKNLSFDALGLLLVMLSMHPAQPKTRDTLVGRGLGRRAVSQALHQLEAEGFRYRFKYAGMDGAWRSVCVLFDTPHDRESAFVAVQELIGDRVTCWRDANDQPLPSAEPGEPVDNFPTKDKTPGQTEVPVPVPRVETTPILPVDTLVSGSDSGSDVKPQVTVQMPRSHRGTGYRPSVGGTSYISKDIYSNKSKDLSFKPHHTSNVTSSLEPDNDSRVDGVDDLGRVRDADASTPRPLDLAAWIPGPFLAVLDTRAAGRVHDCCERAQTRGWTAREVYTHLNETGSLGLAINPAGVVIHRLRQIVNTPPPEHSPARESISVVEHARGELEAIITGTSPLSVVQQDLRLSGYAASPVVMKNLSSLVDQAWSVIQGRLEQPDGPAHVPTDHAANNGGAAGVDGTASEPDAPPGITLTGESEGDVAESVAVSGVK